MPTEKLPTMFFDIEEQDNPDYEELGCGACLSQLTLHTSLPKALKVGRELLVSSLYRATYWECANCGQRYETLTIVSNRPVKERDSTPTLNSRKWVYGFLVTFTRMMLHDTFSIGQHSKKGADG
jgi:hypothetical protein